MDVTEQYLATLTKYGASELTQSNDLVGSNSLVYAKGPSMQRAVEQTVTSIPYEFNYQGDIGLMGAENIFFKINLDIQDTGGFSNCFEEPNWECVKVDLDGTDLDVAYADAIADFDAVEGDTPIYTGANFTNELSFLRADDLLGIRLTNVGTGNIYEDANVDSRLYSDCRFEHAFDDMLVKARGYFYVGIHCRNTKRNAYNVKCRIGTAWREYDNLSEDDKKLLPFCP